jgi:ABC transport system ATP-binding/permease protein
VHTWRALEDLLEDWPGALVAVSHDRAFLERTVDELLVLDGQGTAARLPGGYAAYEAQVRERAGQNRSGISVASVSPGSPPGDGAEREGSKRVSKGRSASTLRHRLKAAQTELTRLERRRDDLEKEVAEVGDDHAALARLGEQLSGVQAEVAEAEERWLVLAEEAEAAGLRV